MPHILASKRALQIVIGILCLVPLSASLAGLILGPTALGAAEIVATDHDSHFRYLSGIFLGVGLGFLSCIPNVEHKTARIRLLTLLVVLGGLARLVSLLVVGAPSLPHLVGLFLELCVTPAVAIWQARLAART